MVDIIRDICFILNSSINTAYTASLNNNIGAFQCSNLLPIPFFCSVWLKKRAIETTEKYPTQ